MLIADRWTFNCAVPSTSVGRGELARIPARSAAKTFNWSGDMSAGALAGCIAQTTATWKR